MTDAPVVTSVPSHPMAGGGGNAVGQPPFSAVDLMLDFLIRAVFDLIQRSIAAPVDRVMVLTAVEGELVRQGRLPGGGFGGIFACFRRIWRREGAGGFLRGVVADAVLTVPSGVVDSFATNAVFVCLQKILPAPMVERMGTAQVVVMSLAATAVAVWVATPFNAIRKTIMTNYMADIVAPIPVTVEVAKDEVGISADVDKKAKKAKEEVREPAPPQQEEMYRYSSATDTARKINSRKGWRAFYRGASMEPVTVCIYRGLYLIASVAVSERLQMMYPYAVARSLAVVADVVTQPLEVVSRRLALTASDDNGAHRYNGVLDCIQTIVRDEGATALWSGLRFRLCINGLSVAIRLLYGAAFGEM